MKIETYPTIPFGDVVTQTTESEKNPLEAGFERYIGLEHLDPESLKIRRWGYIAEDNPSFTRVFRAGQVLFGRRRAYQRKAGIAEFDGICSGDIIVMEAIPDKLLPELLPFLVQSEGFYDYALQTSAGSLSPRTKWSALAKYEFPLPPLDEQQRIAELLWAMEETINCYQHFTDQLLKTRILIFESAVAQANSENSFVATVNDAIIDIVAGNSPKGSSEPAQPDKYGVLKVSAIGAYEYVEEENKALLNESDFVPDYEVQEGYLLVTRANALKSGVARACIVESTRSGLMLSDKTLRLIVDEDHAVTRFLLEALRSRIFRNYVEVVATGTEAKNISQAKLKKAPIPLPPIDIQIEIENILLEYDNAVADANHHIEVLWQLKRSLLNEAFFRGGSSV